MTDQECEAHVNKRLRAYFDDRKKASCIRDRLRCLQRAIEQALDNPHNEDLDDVPASLADDVAELRRLQTEEGITRSFLAENGIDLP